MDAGRSGFLLGVYASAVQKLSLTYYTHNVGWELLISTPGVVYTITAFFAERWKRSADLQNSVMTSSASLTRSIMQIGVTGVIGVE
jgi:hypothetical protein